MKDEIREELKEAEKYDEDARRHLIEAIETLKKRHPEQHGDEIAILEQALKVAEKTGETARKSHESRIRSAEQREELQRIMRKADEEMHRTHDNAE